MTFRRTVSGQSVVLLVFHLLSLLTVFAPSLTLSGQSVVLLVFRLLSLLTVFAPSLSLSLGRVWCCWCFAC